MFNALYRFSITKHPLPASTVQLCAVSVQYVWKVEVEEYSKINTVYCKNRKSDKSYSSKSISNSYGNYIDSLC